MLAAVKAKDFKQVSVAQMMLDQGQKAVNEASANLQTITADRYRLLAKKSHSHHKNDESAAKKQKVTNKVTFQPCSKLNSINIFFT